VDFTLVLIELFSLGVTAELLQAKRDRKSAISLQRVQFAQKMSGTPRIIFALQLAAYSFHTKKLYSRLSLNELRF